MLPPHWNLPETHVDIANGLHKILELIFALACRSQIQYKQQNEASLAAVCAHFANG